MKKKTQFRVRARLLDQLGEQLIKNESVALLELIKNAYDADADTCDVIMGNIEDPERGTITIIDSGSGMSHETLSTVWLEIGTSNKKEKKESADNRSPKYKRIPLGEKGIGRLGVHRLGREIELITSANGKTENRFFVNWDDVKASRYIEDLPFIIEEKRNTDYFKGKTGTKIIIRRLKGCWNRRMVRECSRSITSLNSPFSEAGSFRTTLCVEDSSWLDGLLDFSSIEQYKLFSFDIVLKGNEIKEFKYEFTPWPVMKKLKKRIVELSDIRKLIRITDHKMRDTNLNDFRIGSVRFKGVIFDLDSKTLALGVSDKSGLKKYLKENGGIRVFRDDMRVLDYGEPGNDWLELDSRRVNIPAKKFSNNIVLGAVYLDSELSQDLVEKANREGFVENQSFLALKESLWFAIDRVETLRKIDKDLLRKYYGPKKTDEPVLSSMSEVKTLVEKKVKEDNVRKSLLRYINRIKEDYDRITESLIKSAGAGLNLIIVIHQMQKILKNIIAGIKNKISYKKLEDQVQTLSALVEGYSILIKKSDMKPRDVEHLLKKVLFNIKFRLTLHKIQLEQGFTDKKNIRKAICSESHFMNALMNLFDNSIWWLRYAKVKEPSIFLDVTNEIPNFTSIIVADNGPGFALPIEELTKPFVTAKPGGMGIGLHLTMQIMDSLGGKLLFPDPTDFELPKKYRNGAIVALSFKSGAL